MAYDFGNPVPIYTGLGLVETATTIKNTIDLNRRDTDLLYRALNTSQVGPGDKWIVEDLYNQIDGKLGDVVESGKYFRATDAVLDSINLLKGSKGYRLAAQSYANYTEGKKTASKIQAEGGRALDFGAEKWKTHSSYNQDSNGNWNENIFWPQVETERDYDGEMRAIIGQINADSGKVNFKKFNVSPGDIRTFMDNPYGVSKAKAKRIAMSLIDVYTRGDVGDQDFRSLTQIHNNPTTGMKYTNEEAMDDIANRMIDIASRQTYWRHSYTQMGAPPGGSSSQNNLSAFKPVTSNAINGGLSWSGFDDYMDKKSTAFSAIAANDPQAANFRSTLNALKDQEVQIVNSVGTPEQLDAFNEMMGNGGFRGHPAFRDLLHNLTYNTSKFGIIDIPETDSIEFEGNIIDVPSTYTSSVGTAGMPSTKKYNYSNVRSWTTPRSSELNVLHKQLFGQKNASNKTRAQFIARLNTALGTQYTIDDYDDLSNLVNNYWKYQVTSGMGDSIDKLIEQNEDITVQRTGYAVNTLSDQEGTLDDLNKMLSQITPSQFNIEGIPTESDEWKDYWDTDGYIAKAKRDNTLKFKHITIPGVSSGTTASFVLNVADGHNLSLNENIGGTSDTGFTDALLERISSSPGGNPLLLELDKAARSVNQKITDGTYEVTHDGHISVKDYIPEITPVLMHANLLDYLNKVQIEHGYKPNLSQLSDEEVVALNTALFNRVQNKTTIIMQKLMFMAHIEFTKSGLADDYTNIENEEELWNILSQDPVYRARLEEYAGNYSSSKIKGLINQELYTK